MDDSKDTKPPSLLDKEATGGETSERGMKFQAGMLLSLVPLWLSRDGFEALIREGMGDFEASFFMPGVGVRKEFAEAKDHRLTPVPFWAEVDVFLKMHQSSLGSYQWFRLICAGLSDDLQPLRNGLRRLRDPYEFYRGDTVLAEQSYRDYEQIVLRCGRTPEDARFLYEHVLIEDEHSVGGQHGDALFKAALPRCLPEYQELPARVLDSVYEGVSALIAGRLRKPVSRRKIEQAIRDAIPSNLRPNSKPVQLYTAIHAQEATNALRFEWQDYFGGPERAYPGPEAWNRDVLGQLLQARDWVRGNRTERRVHLNGSRRLSAAVAIGYTFSAVSGFAIEMNDRDGKVWATDDHSGADTPGYSLSENVEGSGDKLIVSIGIFRDAAATVEQNRERLGLAGMPALHLSGNAPIISPAQANLVVRQVKQKLEEALRVIGAHEIHLFYAGPSQLALFLGHRLNATAPIQCYELTEGAYVRTVAITHT